MKQKLILLFLLTFSQVFALDYYSNAGKATSNWGPLGCGFNASGTWEVSGLTWYCMPSPASTHNAVIRSGHTKNHSAADTGPIEINRITIFGTVNLSRTGTGTNNIVDIYVESGGVLNITAGIYNISGQILVKNGGTINVIGGTLRSTSSGNAIVVNSGGIINMNGGSLNRAGGAVTLNVDNGGLININNASGGMSLSSGSAAMCRLDGTIDCKNTLTSFNYSNFNLGETRVTINTSTGRIRTQTAYIPMVNSTLPPTFGNSFFGSNSDFGGTVEYYGGSSIFLGTFSRYFYYDLEVNCPNVYLNNSINYVRGNLYLKAGNLQLNDKILRLMGGIVYTGSSFIAGSTNAELHFMGKLSNNTLESSGMTTFNISTQGSTYDVRYPQLRMSSSAGGNANLKVLRIKREDVVDVAYSNITVNTSLLLESGIFKTSTTSTNHLYVSSTSAAAITHNTTGFSSTASFVSGYLKRNIAAGNSYDFPVGRQDMMTYDGSKHRRMTLEIVSTSGAEQLAVKFTNPATSCTGTLTADEQGISYTQIHPEGFWTVTPTNSTVTAYNELLYVNGFTSPTLTDNMFFTVKRAAGSSSCAAWSDFDLPIPAANQPGRVYNSGQGYAKRSGHTTALGEHAIGMTPTAPTETCTAPSLSLGTLSPSTAQLSWTCAGCTGTFDIYYAPTGTVVGGPGWTTVSGTSPYTITGLTPNTTYDAYVVQDCGASSSVESNVVTFTTNTCNTPTGVNISSSTLTSLTVSWTCVGCTGTFDILYAPAGTTLGGPGWTTLSGNSPFTITGLTAGTDYDVYVVQDCGTGSSGGSTIVTGSTTDCITPTGVNITAQTTSSLTVSWTCIGCTGTFDILVAPTGTTVGGPGWTTFTGTSPYVINGLTPSTAYDVYIVQDCGAASSAGSTVVTGTTSDCITPTGVNISSQTTTSLTVAWTCVGCMGSFDILYAPTGTTVGGPGWTTLTGNSPFLISGLSPSTTYDVYIVQDCGTGSSSGSSVTGTTLTPPCVSPTGISISSITTSSASVSWTCVGCTGTYELYYAPTGTTIGGPGWTMISGNSPQSITGLSQNTTYDVYVIQDCGASNSPESTIETITTNCIPTFFYLDADNDGFGDPNNFISACSMPAGYVSNNTDCDDLLNFVYPGAPELCDGIDNDCDTYIDESSVTWAKSFGGSGIESNARILTDASGNIYTGGIFNGLVDFDPGMGVYNMIAASGGSGYITKLDANGQFLWAKTIGKEVSAFCFDPAGNLLITGNFIGNGGPNLNNIVSSGSTDAFVALFSITGNLISAFKIGGGSQEAGSGIATDASGNIYVTGFFNTQVDFDPNTTNYFITASGYSDIFVAKYSASGSFLWAQKMGGNSHDKSFDLQVGDGVYVAGWFSSSSFSSLTNQGGYDAFLAKLNLDTGVLIWLKGFGGTGSDKIDRLATDALNNVYAVGNFSGSVDFDPNAGSSILTASSTDGFILSFDPFGQLRWAHKMGGSGIDNFNDLMINGNDIFTIGFFRGLAAFSNSSIKLKVLGSVDDVCVVHYQTNGNLIWAKRIGGMNDDEGYGIGQLPNSDLIISGKFDVNTDLETANAFDFTLNSNGSSDVFVARLNACFPTATMESNPNQPDDYNSNAKMIETNSTSDLIVVYPNPNVGIFTIQSSFDQEIDIQIYDLLGQLVYQNKIEKSEIQVDLSHLNSGMYVIQMKKSDEISIQKIQILK